MRWCLAEAMRELDREFLRRAHTVSLMQDSRKRRLLVRFKAATLSLETRRGILGQHHLHGSMNGSGLREGTLATLRTLCTKGLGAPSRPPGAPEPVFDEALMEHMVKSVEEFSADAAADEQHAGGIRAIATSWGRPARL